MTEPVSVVNICCSSARIALCNYEFHFAVLLNITKLHSPWQHLMSVERTRDELLDASKSITSCLKQLLGRHLAGLLPSSAVGCTALPLALYMLDVKLNSAPSTSPKAVHTLPQVSESQSRLNLLIQAMKEYHPRYEGADWISKTIRYFMECTYLDEPLSSSMDPVYSNHRSWGQHFEGVQAGVLTSNPTYYLRLALTMDLSLSQDRLPEETDFPLEIRGVLNRLGCFMPILFGQEGGVTLSKASKSCTSVQNVTGWIENDRSLYFALEMGLGPNGSYEF